MLMLNLPHLPVGMRRRCQVFLPVCCVWPCCFPLNETWLTVMLTESITFKLLILCHKPRETDFFLSPAVLKESRNQTTARDALLASVTHCKDDLEPGWLTNSSAKTCRAAGVAASCSAACTWPPESYLPCSIQKQKSRAAGFLQGSVSEPHSLPRKFRANISPRVKNADLTLIHAVDPCNLRPTIC